MKQFTVFFAIVAFWAFFSGVEASSLLACTYGPQKTAIVQNQYFIERIEDTDKCIRRVDCTQDLQIEVIECKNMPYPADTILNMRYFPDCCF